MCTCSWTVYVAHGGNISSRSILSRKATWTVQEQGSSSNVRCFLGFRACSLRRCIHFDAVLCPRAYRGGIVPNEDRYYDDLCMNKNAIDEMRSSLFSSHLPEASHRCLSHPVSTQVQRRRIRITKSYLMQIKLLLTTNCTSLETGGVATRPRTAPARHRPRWPKGAPAAEHGQIEGAGQKAQGQ